MPFWMTEFVVYSLVGILSAYVTWWLLARSDKRQKVLALFERYRSPETIQPRHKAWRYLKTEHRNEPIWELYSDRDPNGQERYGPLVHVMYFWHSLVVLAEEDVVDT